MAAICGDVNTVSRRASPFKGARPPKDHYGKIEHVFAEFEIRAQQLTNVLVRDLRQCGRQACRALDASEKSAEEDGVDAEVHEFSEHFWNR